MEFTVEVLDYGRHGVVVKEPRTGLTGEGDNEEAATDDLILKLWFRMEYDFIPDEEGPRRSMKKITV